MDWPAGKLVVRAIAPLGFASFGRSLSNVVWSADKLQVLRFAKDDNTPGLLGLPIFQNRDGAPLSPEQRHILRVAGLICADGRYLDVDVFSI
jgi:hypothetical protein